VNDAHLFSRERKIELSRLNEAERRVLLVLAEGHTAKSIATELDTTPAAVNERLRQARRKTGVGSSGELARVLTPRLSRPAAAPLSVLRSRRALHLVRTHLHAPQKNLHLNRAGRPKARNQGGRRGHLAHQLHALRPRIHRSGAENAPANRQPIRPGCHPCLRNVLSPMCPDWTPNSMVPDEGFEPPTFGLQNRCSTN
jgi:DNA-binding CsgD family transcriptional regulator